MSYYTERPTVVDVDADRELQADVFSSDERGTVVRLSLRDATSRKEEVADLELPIVVWQRFARAVAKLIREEES